MPDRYAPALLLDVVVFWFVLRWVLPASILMLFARALAALMAVGTLGALGQHHFLWTVFETPPPSQSVRLANGHARRDRGAMRAAHRPAG